MHDLRKKVFALTGNNTWKRKQMFHSAKGLFQQKNIEQSMARKITVRK
jgi:hypothetical protein